jgi:hypothetical protein
MLLAQCTISADEWIDIMKRKGFIEEGSDKTDS